MESPGDRHRGDGPPFCVMLRGRSGPPRDHRRPAPVLSTSHHSPARPPRGSPTPGPGCRTRRGRRTPRRRPRARDRRSERCRRQPGCHQPPQVNRKPASRHRLYFLFSSGRGRESPPRVSRPLESAVGIFDDPSHRRYEQGVATVRPAQSSLCGWALLTCKCVEALVHVHVVTPTATASTCCAPSTRQT